MWRWTTYRLRVAYSLEFLPSALKEWRSLGGNIRDQFKKKLQERLQSPHVPTAKLSGMPDCYKIKITTPQFRLACHVDDKANRLTILAASSRDDVYVLLATRQS